jgi:hypothetical protein
MNIYLPDGPVEREEWQESCYDQKMDALDAREAAAQELSDALVDIASTRIDAFGIMRDLK